MKRVFMAALILIISSAQVTALSCVVPDVANSFNGFSESKETYIMVLGKLVNQRNLVAQKEGRNPNQLSPESYTATFVGKMATRSGFDRDIEINVAVRGECALAWCGHVKSDVEMIAFVQKTWFGYKLTQGLCGGSAFYNPNEKIKTRAMQCMRGGICQPQP